MTKILGRLEAKLSKFFDYLERNFLWTLIFLFLLSLVTRFAFTPFDLVLRKDAYYYLIKGIEIVSGNFAPVPIHSIGLPFFISPFLSLLGSTSIFFKMTLIRVISIFVGSLSIFPLMAIGRELLGKRKTIFLLIFFTFASHLIIDSTSALTEPLFMFLLLTCVYLVILSKRNINYVLLASFFAALAYWVRPNGLFLLVFILLVVLIYRKKLPNFKYRYFIWIIAIFLLISAPFLYQRALSEGSPFSYGMNDRFLGNSYEEAWCFNIPTISFLGYFKTHNLADYFNKFFVHGFTRIFFDYFYKVISPLLLFFFIFAFFKNLKDKRFLPLYLIFLLWIGGLSLIYSVVGSSRHLHVTIPFILIFGVKGVFEVFKDKNYKNVLLTLFTIVFILFSLISPLVNVYKASYQETADGLEWGKWVAENVKGKVAMIDGGDLIMMHLTEVTFDEYSALAAPNQGIRLIVPGCFQDLSSGMDWLRERGTTHLVLDEKIINRRPYLEEAHNPKFSSVFKEIYSNQNTSSQWKVNIYKIDWESYDKLK